MALEHCHPQMPRGSAAAAPAAGVVKRLPYPVYLVTVLGLCLAGLALSVYLAVSHFRVHTDLVYQSFCAISKAINCDTVSQSEYSVVFGLPVSVWGAFGYTFFLMLAAVAVATPRSPRGWDLLLLMSIVFSLTSIVFAGVSALRIGSYCLLCILTYAVNFLLLFFTWVTRRRFPSGGLRSGLRQDLRFLRARCAIGIPALAGLAFALGVTWYAIPPYWQYRPPRAATPVPSGITEAGHAWIGAEHPMLEIIEFTDYRCFQCRKMHHYLRELVVRYPDKIRLVHRNYPMDHEFNPIVKEPFHSGSGRMALLAIHGAATGTFWEFNDRLFERAAADRISFKDLAAETGMDPQILSAALTHEPYRLQLLRDIREGMKLGIVGTPSYVIGGKVYEGGIPSEVLQPVIGDPEK
jgi:uncharacterized membrane protein/protein-disulfide isomerase